MTRQVFCSIIRLDADMSDAVDILKQSNEWMQSSGHNSNELLQRGLPSITPKDYKKRSFNCDKGGTVFKDPLIVQSASTPSCCAASISRS